MSTITALGAGNGAAIESAADYRHQLKRSMLLPLQELRPSLITSVIAVVTQLGAVKKTQGTDYLLSLQVADPTVGHDNPVLVSIFRRCVETMPDIRGPGDIIYLDSAKTSLVGGRCHLYNNFTTYWQILHHDAPVDGLHPILAHLRHWWQTRHTGTLAAGQQLRPVSRAASEDDIASDTSAAASPIAPSVLSPPPQLPQQQTTTPTAHDPSNSRFQTTYLKQIGEFEVGRFGDIVVEVLHVEPPVADPFFVGQLMQRCLVTDYTANPMVSLVRGIPAAKRVGGRRLVWCEIHEVGKINKMPELRPNRMYWMRGAKAVSSHEHGLTLDVRLHIKYQRTVLVAVVDDDDPTLDPLKGRRLTVPTAHIAPLASSPPQPQAMHTLALAEADPAPAPPPNWVADAAVTPIASIHADQQINVQYHVRARIASIFPDTADQCMVSVCAACGARLDPQQQLPCPACHYSAAATRTECQFVLELTDESASCVAMYVGAAPALLQRISQLVGGPWADMLVALVLVPGPGPAPGSLVRCLVVSDASALPDSAAQA